MFTVIIGALCLLIIIVTLTILLGMADKKFDTLTGEYRELRSTSSGIAEDNLSKAKEIRRLNDLLVAREKENEIQEEKEYEVEFKILPSWNGWAAWVIYGPYDWQKLRTSFESSSCEDPEERARYWIERFKSSYLPLEKYERGCMIHDLVSLTNSQKRRLFLPPADGMMEVLEEEE